MGKWKEYKIGDIISLEYGKTLTDYRTGIGEYDVFGTNGKIGKTNKFIFEKPSVIIGRKGAYREVYFAEKAFFVIDTAFYTNNIIEELDVQFLYYWFKNIDINAMDSGSAIPSTSRYEVYDLDISLPALNEQKSIKNILGNLDDKINLLHRQNVTLEAMAETLFRQWFVEEAKESWKIGKLSDEFDFTMGSSPPGESYNQDGIGMPMYQGNADFGFRFPLNRVFTTNPIRIAEKFDTLISVRAPVGDQNMANEKCCIGRGVAAFRYMFDNSFYTYTYFKIKTLMNEIKQFNETGTVFGSISKTDFEDLDIIIPEKNVVNKFQSEVKPIDDKIITNTIQIITLIKLRDTLLPKLMSGEVRIES